MATASPRERLLTVADELFNAHGIHAIGIDRVIATARVAKATLYAHFPTKDHLVGAYLEGRLALLRRILEETVAAEFPDSVSRVLSTYARAEDICHSPDFRGCVFVNAAAEYSKEGPVLDVVHRYRRWIHAFYADLADRSGFAQPVDLGAFLVQTYDGLLISAHLDGDRKRPVDLARRSLHVILASWERTDADHREGLEIDLKDRQSYSSAD